MTRACSCSPNKRWWHSDVRSDWWQSRVLLTNIKKEHGCYSFLQVIVKRCEMGDNCATYVNDASIYLWIYFQKNTFNIYIYFILCLIRWFIFLDKQSCVFIMFSPSDFNVFSLNKLNYSFFLLGECHGWRSSLGTSTPSGEVKQHT